MKKFLIPAAFLCTITFSIHLKAEKVNSSEGRIELTPMPGTMGIKVDSPHLDGAKFQFAIPETIGCREMVILNWVEVNEPLLKYDKDEESGIVSCSYSPGGRLQYDLRVIPAVDYIDLEMTITNITDYDWTDVYSFNCIKPQTKHFDDPELVRTFMSVDGKPTPLSEARGAVPGTVATYFHEDYEHGSHFMQGTLGKLSKDTDDSWIAAVSEEKNWCMASNTKDSVFLFNNVALSCIHSAPSFGNIDSATSATNVSRVYLMKGSLEDFLERKEADQEYLK